MWLKGTEETRASSCVTVIMDIVCVIKYFIVSVAVVFKTEMTLLQQPYLNECKWLAAWYSGQYCNSRRAVSPDLTYPHNTVGSNCCRISKTVFLFPPHAHAAAFLCPLNWHFPALWQATTSSSSTSGTGLSRSHSMVCVQQVASIPLHAPTYLHSRPPPSLMATYASDRMPVVADNTYI